MALEMEPGWGEVKGICEWMRGTSSFAKWAAYDVRLKNMAVTALRSEAVFPRSTITDKTHSFTAL